MIPSRYRRVNEHGETASRLNPVCRYQHASQPASPKNSASSIAQSVWYTGTCSSCTRNVSSSGTQIQMSVAPRRLPPRWPVSPIVAMPFAPATRVARQTFRAFPDVEMPSSASPGRPSTYSCCANTRSEPMSFCTAGINGDLPMWTGLKPLSSR